MTTLATVTCTLTGQGPYSQSQAVRTPKNKGEADDAYDARVWREHIHSDDDGKVFIPPMALQKSLTEVAQFLGEKLGSGKGGATWTKHFLAGLFIAEPIYIGKTIDDAQPEKLFVSAKGDKAGGERVWRTYPRFTNWSGKASITLIDDRLIQAPEKVREYLEKAGVLIGLGRWRPRNGGLYGRFTVSDFKVK